jgi:hypothetical protein
MFTVTNKLRTIVAIGAVGAALASSGVGSAATFVRPLGIGRTVVAVQPTTTVAQYIDPHNVGSAGIPGYDNAKCQSLAKAHNADENSAVQSAKNGDAVAAQGFALLAGDLQTDLQDNCLVID